MGIASLGLVTSLGCQCVVRDPPFLVIMVAAHLDDSFDVDRFA